MFHRTGKPATGTQGGVLRRLFGRSRRWEDRADCYSENQDRILSASSDVQASAHDDGIALLHISTGRIFLCNRTGSRIWQGIVSGLSADAIAEEISQDCGVAWNLVRRHTLSFFLELEQRGLAVRKADHSS